MLPKCNFYTLHNEETGNHRVFAVTKDTYSDGLLLTKVKHRPYGEEGEPTAGKCACDFVGIPDCPRHFHKPFARITEKGIVVFQKLMADVNEHGVNEWLKFAKILEVLRFNIGGNAVSGYANGKVSLVLYEAVPCSRCGELLTNPESIKKGIGPVCESYEG